MKNATKSAKIALAISVFALIIALINLICSSINGLQIGSAVTLFGAMLAVFCANIVNCKRGNNSDK